MSATAPKDRVDSDPAVSHTPPADAPPTVPPPWARPLFEQVVREMAPATPRLVDFTALKALVPLSERTLRDALRRGLIPHIRLPGARRLLFSLEDVLASLRRFSKGGLS